MDPLAQSKNLHARAQAFVRAYMADAPMPETFDALACDLARFQAAQIPGYARLCARHRVNVEAAQSSLELPAVPTDAFKVARIFAFADEPRVFQTSGTTVGRRGRHVMRTTDTYDLAALAFGRRMLMPVASTANDARVAILVLGPPPSELPDSSLGHMISHFAQELGTSASQDETYFLRDGVIELPAFDERVARLLLADGAPPALLLGTSFAFVHFLDALGEDTFRLPAGSRVMQTGGFKGKSREVSAEELRRDIARVFCIEEDAVVSEYGMTELSSQFYTRAGKDALQGVFTEPPWARVTPVDPETLEPVPQGQVGIARITDLCNVDSAVVVQTQDLVRRVEHGFVLLGRSPGATPRGCSIAIDEMLGPS